ncbi:MAG: PilW family type IVa pilus biogenesis/stability lipoprotein TapF [Gammaproteobacteria bacterium]
MKLLRSVLSLLVIGMVAVLLNACTLNSAELEQQQQDNQAAAEYNVDLGVAYLRQGNTERAQLKLNRALQQAPNSSSVYNALAYFAEKTAQPDKAKTYYEKAIALDPQAGAPENNYGAFLCRQGKYQQAQHHFKAAINKPNYIKVANAYQNAGLCAVRAGDKNLAEHYFKRAVAQDPQLWPALYQLAKLAYEKKRYQEANQYLARYVLLNKQPEPEVLWLAIQVARGLGDHQQAQHFVTLLKTRFPQSEQAQHLKK